MQAVAVTSLDINEHPLKKEKRIGRRKLRFKKRFKIRKGKM